MAYVKRSKAVDILCIGDSHSHPDFANDRYDWLSEYIKDTRPDVVVDIGDSADMAALCQYDKGKRCAEGRRYEDDITAYQDSNERTWGFLKRTRRYNPRRVKTLGNHEHRIDRATQEAPELYGKLSMSDLDQEKYWEVYPFLEAATINGVRFAHYMPSGTMARPIGGEHLGAALLKKNFVSCVVGHTHTFDYSVRHTPDGDPVIGLGIGCYFDYWAEYAGPANLMYYRGLVRLNNVENGNYDVEQISLDRLRKAYG